jgi:predicted amidohydrolase
MTMKTPDIYAGNPPSLKVAMCQVHTEQWEVEGNLARTLAALEQAAAEGAQLAVTPECVLRGYGFEVEGSPRVLDVADSLDSPNVLRVCAAAKELGMDVVLGFAERAGDVVHNSAAFIGRDGRIVDVYRKVHCRGFEDVTRRGWFTAGDRFFALDRRWGEDTFRIGTMICFDREVTESVRCLRAAGSQLIACPLACDTSDAASLGEQMDNEIITRCRAAENEVFIVVVNHAGRFNGGSFAVGPGGQVLHQMGKDPGVAVIDVPVGAVPRDFHSKPLGWMGWGYRRPEVYERYLSA